jgi:hypothetical protein
MTVTSTIREFINVEKHVNFFKLFMIVIQMSDSGDMNVPAGFVV